MTWYEVWATQPDGSKAAVFVLAREPGEAVEAGRAKLEVAGKRAHPELTACRLASVDMYDEPVGRYNHYENKRKETKRG